jgi:opacity protein-like surface antigen
MKKLLLGIAAIVALFTAPALAADMPLKAPPAVVSAEYNWSGFYVGANAGWMESNFHWQYTNPAPATCCAPFSAMSAMLLSAGKSARNGSGATSCSALRRPLMTLSTETKPRARAASHRTL